jgi:hypothetical protein
LSLDFPSALLGVVAETVADLLESVLEFRELRRHKKIECPFQLSSAPQLNDLSD